MNLIAVQEALKNSSPDRNVTLVAVSKMQSKETIKEAYDLGQRDFGENYVQELIDKAQALKESCPEIRWHFIGSLQSNKIGQLIKSVPGLVAIETVDSLSKFEKIVKAADGHELELALFIQVNISGEESKHGVKDDKEEIIQIYRRHQEMTNTKCRLEGLMMIGEPEASERDFIRMCQLKAELQKEVGWIGCKISMGMSADFELAARLGSDIVRVGSAIFGERSK